MVNWLFVGLAAGVVYAGILVFFLARSRWTAAALGVALANFLYVLLHLVAPFRGPLDPHYEGYRAGLFDVAPGPAVSLVAGAIVVGALTAACLALLNRPGRGMAFIAGVDVLLLITIALPEALDGLRHTDQYRIELGEYLQIPGLFAVAILGLIFCLPLVLSVVWSVRRVRMHGGVSLVAGQG
jgi:hypothetical protein